MATFSQQFLANLGRPAMTESLFGLGRAIGGLPGQAQDRRKQQQFNQLMQQGQAAMASGDAAKLAQTAQDLAAAGYQKEAQQFSAASREATARQKRQEALAGVDLSSPAGLNTLSEFYKQQGNVAQAVELATAARERQTEINEANRFTERKVKLANTAFGLGLNDLAERIPGITDPEELRTVATEMRKAEVEKMPTQSPLVRKQMAKAAGIPDRLFGQLDLANVSDAVFSSYLTGQKGDMKFFLKGDKVVDYRVNKESGLVFDKDTGTWTEASALGLQPAPPQVQRVENVSSGMADELSKVGADNFVEAYEGAKKSAEALSSINRSLPKLDQMFTGAGAEIKLNLSRYARTLGVDLADPNTIANTETYIADAGRRVAEYITNLGAGTGLSDADRQYAERVVGGSIAVDELSLKRLLEDLRKGAKNKIESYQKIRAQVKKELGEGGEAALSFFAEDFYIDEGPAPVRSSAAQSFLDAASQ
jgi:hypothetical protein